MSARPFFPNPFCVNNDLCELPADNLVFFLWTKTKKISQKNRVVLRIFAISGRIFIYTRKSVHLQRLKNKKKNIVSFLFFSQFWFLCMKHGRYTKITTTNTTQSWRRECDTRICITIYRFRVQYYFNIRVRKTTALQLLKFGYIF